MRSQGQRKSKRQERSVAKELGGKVQKASGATPFAKGDVRVQGELKVECKTTSKRFYNLKFSDLLKIYDEAAQHLEDWLFQVEFQGQVGHSDKLAIMLIGTYESVMKRMASFHKTEVVTDKKSIELTFSDHKKIIWTVNERTMRLAVMPWNAFEWVSK